MNVTCEAVKGVDDETALQGLMSTNENEIVYVTWRDDKGGLT
ncbi:hypothetical protein ACFLSW_04360 [Candidatus Bipolaricaulota bacterium]